MKNTKSVTVESLKKIKDDAPVVYAILQLKSGEELHDKRFQGYSRIIKNYGNVSLNDYEMKGAFAIKIKENDGLADVLENIFAIWNMPDRPENVHFTGHSLSVSDIIAVFIDNNVRFFYCDIFGFEELKNEFMQL